MLHCTSILTGILAAVAARENCPTYKFQPLKNFSSCSKILSKNVKFLIIVGPHFGGKFEQQHLLHCKCVVILRKIQHFLLALKIVTHNAAGDSRGHSEY